MIRDVLEQLTVLAAIAALTLSVCVWVAYIAERLP